MERCRGCAFWREITDGRESPEHHFAGFGPMGHCKRYPPSFNPAAQVPEEDLTGEYEDWLAARFPITADYEWCGEWQAAPAPT